MLNASGAARVSFCVGLFDSMHKKCLLVLTVATVVFGASFLLHQFRAGQNPPPAPVTLRYTYGMNKWWNESPEPTFWATNHSDKTLGIMLRTIEIQTNGAWVTYSHIPLPGQLFFPTNQGNPGPIANLLAPHAAGLCSLLNQHLILPTNAVWRVSGSVVEKMEGGDAIVWTASHARLLAEGRRVGITNIPINPFARHYTRLGHPSAVVSEAVVSR
jgi:hypothetical protein